MKNYFKTLIGVFMLCFLAANSLQAQGETRIGFRVGGNLSRQEFKSGNITVEPKSKFGLDLALVADLPLGGDIVSISPELHWLQKGYEIEDISGPFDNASATLNYLELPILVKFNFGEEARFFVMGGPSIGYLLSGKFENFGVEIDPDYDFINRLELGAHVGAGVGIGPLVIDVRYFLGLSNFVNDDPTFDEIKNTGFGLGVGVMF